MINHGIKSDQLPGQHLWIYIQNCPQRWQKIVVIVIESLITYLSAGAVKPINVILRRNIDHSACIDIMNIDYHIVGNFDGGNIDEFEA